MSTDQHSVARNRRQQRCQRNGGKARSQGFEWSLGYVPVHGLTLQWTAAYTDAKLTTDAPAVHGVTGDPLPYAPKWGTSIDGEYDAPAWANWKYFAGATWSYVGSRSTDFGSDFTQLLQVRLPSYNTVGTRVGLDNDRWRWTLYAKNLNDSRGITAYTSSGAPWSQRHGSNYSAADGWHHTVYKF